MSASQNKITSVATSKDDNCRQALLDYLRQPECKRLINRILVAQKEKGIKSIVVLSQFAGEGKTFCISTLALGFCSKLKKRVLIMDTVSQCKDDSFYCHEFLKPKEVVNHPSEKTPGCIDLITTRSVGHTFDPDQLSLPVGEASSQLMQIAQQEMSDCADFEIENIVNAVKDSYDLILIDTCAVSESNKESFDPMILAQYADSSIIVSSKSSMNRDTLGKLVGDLRRYQITPLGVVVNPGVAYAA